jgi:hypothetical protein
MECFDILDYAEGFAQMTLHPLEHTYNKPTQAMRYYSSHHEYWVYSSPSYDYYIPVRQEEEQEKKEITIILTAIAIFATTYVLGKDYSALFNASTHLSEIEKQKSSLLYSQDPRKERVIEVIALEHKLATTLYTKAMGSLLTKTALLTSLVAFGAGLIVNAPALCAGAILGTTASTTAILFHMGYNHFNSSLQMAAHQLLQAVHHARS